LRSIQYGHAYGSDTKNGELCPNTELTDWGFDIVRRDGVFKVDQMNPEVDYQNMRSFTPLQWAHYHGQKVLAKAIADKYNTKNK
jgi:hypothetical protein